jgi:myo-inositol-1(or 4)-monophosphatase
VARRALECAVTAARAAADEINRAAPSLRSLKWVEKGVADYVTEVDRAAESRIAEIVGREFPSALMLAEELTPDVAMSAGRIVFIVDPLDGTTNFLHGYPQYSVSIAVYDGFDHLAAVVLNVARGDLFTATAGGGTALNGVPVRVSPETSPARALIGTGFPFRNPDLLERYARQFVDVSRQVAGVRRAGSAALDLADVACGRFDAFWELVLAPWDIAAGLILVREAGGVVTDLGGSELGPAHGPVVAGNPDVHRWLLRVLADADTNTYYD